jgi:ubiquinone/menaquinone biosynthesis C-methylase UbiE
MDNQRTRIKDQKQRVETDSGDANKLDLRNEIQEAYGAHPQPWFRWVFARIDLPERARILEIGGGTGSLWHENRDAIPPGWEIIISDLLPGMVATAQHNLDQLSTETAFLSSDSQGLPFPDGSFDAVVAVGVLDLVPDLNQALAEIRRVIRPSGLFATTAGGRKHLLEMRQMLKPFLPGEKADQLGGEEGQFGLENGEAKLACYLENTRRQDYLDRLTFTEVQPILNYILSEDAITQELTLYGLGKFTRALKQDLTRQGKIEVVVQKCLFTTRKPQ